MTFALIYHDIVVPEDRDAVGFPGQLAARYKFTPRRFEEHLDAIAATGVGIGLVGDDGTGPQATLTFDDGGASALHAAASLERRGWRGHFFITTSRIGTPGFLDADGVRELAGRGHAVGSHSHTHPTYMGHLSRDQIAGEWRDSRAALTEVLGRPPTTAAVPGGSLSEVVIEEAVAAGYSLLMTSQPTARVRNHNGLAVLGRHTVWTITTPRRAAGYARGDWGARGRLWLEWQVKGVPKRLAPDLYMSLRKLRARRT